MITVFILKISDIVIKGREFLKINSHIVINIFPLFHYLICHRCVLFESLGDDGEAEKKKKERKNKNSINSHFS